MLKRLLRRGIDLVNETTTPLPEPFLGPIFEPGVESVITTGFNYTQAEIDIHGVKVHGAIDFDVPRGTSVMAAADGWATAYYGEVLMTVNGKPRLVTLEQIKKANPARDYKLPNTPQPWQVYYGSLVVQIWHSHGRYTQYAHLDWINPEIPYYPPVRDKKTGDWEHNPMRVATVDKYRDRRNAAFIKAGDVIGETGMTGCGLGLPCYGTSLSETDYTNHEYTYYSSPHLHFVVFGRRAPYTRVAKVWDSFGVYSVAGKAYPTRVGEWASWYRINRTTRHRSLWLPQQ